MIWAQAPATAATAALALAIALAGCSRLDPLKESVSENHAANPSAPAAAPESDTAHNGGYRSPLDPPDTPDNLRDRASQGDPIGQYWMGYLHEYGTRGITKDLKAALNFYKLAADQGHEQAVIAAERVEGKLKDPKSEAEDAMDHQKAEDVAAYVQRIKKSADAGRPESQYLLGVYHEHGRYGVEANISLAKEYYQKAAEQGNEKAMVALERLSQQQ
ncbi:MAG TPA: tetratricopeptide repeat protein [Verrucomicrobiae bacterium]|nr:tetratricopeptide repeat protein [Verrucomicrobiae bacterium]